jgi:hypothetical protein
MRGIIVALALMVSGCVTAELNLLDERTGIVSGRGTAFDNPADRTPVRTEVKTQEVSDCSDGYCEDETVTRSTTSGGELNQLVEPGSDVTVRFLHADEIRRGMGDVWEAASVLAVQRRR